MKFKFFIQNISILSQVGLITTGLYGLVYFGAVGFGIGSQCELGLTAISSAPCDERTHNMIYTGFYISAVVVFFQALLFIKILVVKYGVHGKNDT